jgi:hypothetical protein
MSSDGRDLNPNDNNAHLVYYPAAVFAGLCPILVALRTWARVRRGGKMSADDWTAWAALVCRDILKEIIDEADNILPDLQSPYKCFSGSV